MMKPTRYFKKNVQARHVEKNRRNASVLHDRQARQALQAMSARIRKSKHLAMQQR
jgi:hypothetical protein